MCQLRCPCRENQNCQQDLHCYGITNSYFLSLFRVFVSCLAVLRVNLNYPILQFAEGFRYSRPTRLPPWMAPMGKSNPVAQWYSSETFRKEWTHLRKNAFKALLLIICLGINACTCGVYTRMTHRTSSFVPLASGCQIGWKTGLNSITQTITGTKSIQIFVLSLLNRLFPLYLILI